MTCPSCGGELDASLDRCPVCDSGAMTHRVEGALAKRVEPLRDIPGLRKKERTWRDEVQERVQSRRQKRASAGLPLFDQEPAEPEEAPQPVPVVARAVDPAAPAAVRDAAATPSVESPLAPAMPQPPLAAPLPSDDFVNVRLSEAELGDLPLNTGGDANELQARAREEAVPRATRRVVPSLDEDLVPEAELTPDVELPPLVAEAPPLERPASALERAHAAAVDVLLFGALAMVVVYFTGRAARVELIALVPSWPGLAFYLGLLALFYAGYFTGTTGQTPGKLLTRLRVVGSTGRPPSYLRAMARAALGLVGIVLAGAALLPMAFDPARRGVHDRLFKTRVVRH